MKDIFIRTKQIANYVINFNCTIRQVAKIFNMAKSTVHYDLKYRLPKTDMAMFLKVQKILEKNFQEKNIRGGEATRQKYIKNKQKERD